MPLAKKFETVKFAYPRGLRGSSLVKQRAYLDILGQVCIKHSSGLPAFKKERLFLNKHIFSVWEDASDITHTLLFI